jgi:hypothetical protein
VNVPAKIPVTYINLALGRLVARGVTRFTPTTLAEEVAKDLDCLKEKVLSEIVEHCANLVLTKVLRSANLWHRTRKSTRLSVENPEAILEAAAKLKAEEKTVPA